MLIERGPFSSDIAAGLQLWARTRACGKNPKCYTSYVCQEPCSEATVSRCAC